MQELTFKEIYSTLLPKFKLLLVILLIGAVVGGCVGVARTYASIAYGTTIEFYVNPKRSEQGGTNDSQFGVYGAYGWHVMDNMTKLLASESFAEDMLLDVDGLPIDVALKGLTDRTEIDKKISDAKTPIAETKEAELAVEEATEILAEKKLAYTTASSVANKANNKYISLVTAKAPDDEISIAKADAEAALAIEEQAKLDFETAEQDKIVKENYAKQKNELADEKINDVIDYWRQTEFYSTLITMITESVQYSFYDINDLQSNNTDTLAKSFIYVTISTPGGEETAKFIYDRINEVLPRFVETNMAVPSGYVGTNCQRITRLDEVKQTGAENLLGSAFKYAAILGILALILSMTFVILIDRFKKWSALGGNAEGAELNTSDVALGDGAARPTSEANDQGESTPEWQ